MEQGRELRRYELCITSTRKEMMRLCRIVEREVRSGNLSFERAERHYLARVRAVNKMAYHYLNISRLTRHRWMESHTTRIYKGSDEAITVTKTLHMFNTLSKLLFRIIRRMKTNVAFSEVN